MRQFTRLSTTLLVSAIFIGLCSADDTEEPTVENTTIKSVMNGAHKGPPKGTGLLKKVATGKASEDEAKHLLALYKVMTQLEPPVGEADSWKERSGLLVSAVEAIVAGQDEGQQMLSKASNCKACHEVHKE